MSHLFAPRFMRVPWKYASDSRKLLSEETGVHLQAAETHLERRVNGNVRPIDRPLNSNGEDRRRSRAAAFTAPCIPIREGPKEASAAQQIAALRGMAMSIVHDLRNPVAAIQLGADMLIGSRLSEPQLQRLARNLYGASSHIQELLQEFLEAWCGNIAHPEPTDLRNLVVQAVSKVAAAAESQSVEIAQEVPEDLVIALDRRRIRRVLTNLFVNALEAMPGGGSILVSVTAQAGAVLFEVQDTGPGIAPEILASLFQPFVTARKEDGLGLGLAFSRQAIVDHGGDMWAESSPGHGACVAFRLPMGRRDPDFHN